MALLDTLMQWLHILAAVTGIGAFIYGRLVVIPALAGLPAESRTKLVEELVARMRPLSFSVIGVLVATGTYNIVAHMAGRPAAYHIALGIKLLLALHVFSVAVLLSTPPGLNPARDARRPRLMMGAVISGTVILLISAFLRRAF
jgi:uncharacterized membrane protein